MTAPRGNHSDSHLNQLLTALAQYIDGVTVPVPLTTTTILRVDTAGDNGTALPGRFDLPYLTITAALAASAPGDTILIGPGQFDENVVIPAARTSIHIVGSGMYATTIRAATAGGTALAWTAAGAVCTGIDVRNLTLQGQNGLALAITAAAQLSSFDETADGRNGLKLDHVYLVSAGAAAGTIHGVNYTLLRECVTPDTLAFTQCSSLDAFDCQLGGTTFTFAGAPADQPSVGLRTKKLHGCVLASLNQATLDQVVCDTDCAVGGNIVTAVTQIAGPVTGSLEFHGMCFGNMNLQQNLSVIAATPFLCDRCKLVGLLDISNVAANLGTAIFCNAVLYAAAAGAITPGKDSAVDLIGAQYDHTAGVLDVVGNGVCNRSILRQVVFPTTGGGLGPDPFTFAGIGEPNMMDANYTVLVEAARAAVDPQITAKGVAGFAVTDNAVGAGTVNLLIVHE